MLIRKINFKRICSLITGCSFNPLARENGPLPISPTRNEIIYPLYGSVNLKANENIDFACPGGKVVLNTQTSSSSVAQASCVSDQRFEISGQEYQFNQIHCNQVVLAESRFTGKTCSAGKEAEIGFNLGYGRFIRQILLCFDTVRQTTLYAQHEVVSVIGGSAVAVPRPFFEQDRGFFSVGSTSVNDLYLRNR